MKKILLGAVMAATVGLANAGFIHPMDFDGSESSRDEAITYIKGETRHTYCEVIDMCSNSILRMMEKQELSSFKYLTKQSDREVMDGVIYTYCETIDMCSYSTIKMMYNQEVKSKKDSLTW